MAPAINVLHIIGHFRIGGAQTLLLDLLPMLDRNKYSVTVCCLRKPTPLSKEAEARGLNIIYLNRGKYDPRQVFDITKIIQRYKIQLVHTHLRDSSIIGRLAAVLSRVPVIIHHDHSGSEPFNRMPPVVRHLLVLADSVPACFTDKFIVISQYLRDYQVIKRKVDPHKVTVVHNWIDLHKFSPERFNSTGSKEKLGIEPSATH